MNNNKCESIGGRPSVGISDRLARTFVYIDGFNLYHAVNKFQNKGNYIQFHRVLNFLLDKPQQSFHLYATTHFEWIEEIYLKIIVEWKRQKIFPLDLLKK